MTPTPRTRIQQLLATHGVQGEALLRAMGTFWALALVGRDGTTVRTSHLADRLGLEPQTLAAVLADLAQAGLVEPNGDGVRIRQVEGLDEAVNRLIALGFTV